jgi:hypothetical protein
MVSSSSRKGLLPRSPYPRSKTLRNGRKDLLQQLNNLTTTQIPLRCHRCKSQITVADRKKTKKPTNGAYFKTCKRCREKRNPAKWIGVISKSTPPKLSTSNHISSQSNHRSSQSNHTSSQSNHRSSQSNHGSSQSHHESSKAELDCSVCADTLPAQSFPNLSGCEHRPDVCRTCFLAWVTERMDSTVWERIKCPSSDCRKLLTHDDVKAHAPEDVFARYVSVVRLLSSSIDSITDSTICLSGIF